MKKKGFVFVETIIVTAILLASLMLVYSLFVSNKNDENKRMRYDDTAKIYETHYLKQYFESFDLAVVTSKISNDMPYQFIYRGQSEIFGDQASNESKFFSELWEKLGIASIVVLPYDLTDILKCERRSNDICSNKDLYAYLKTLDSSDTSNASEKYRMIVEYSSKQDGTSCGSSEDDLCFRFFSNIDFISRPKVYYVDYDANGGDSAPSADEKLTGESVSISNFVPIRDGYEFTNWNTKPDGSGIAYNGGASYSEDHNIILYAQWKVLPPEAPLALSVQLTMDTNPELIIRRDNTFDSGKILNGRECYASIWSDNEFAIKMHTSKTLDSLSYIVSYDDVANYDLVNTNNHPTVKAGNISGTWNEVINGYKEVKMTLAVENNIKRKDLYIYMKGHTSKGETAYAKIKGGIIGSRGIFIAATYINGLDRWPEDAGWQHWMDRFDDLMSGLDLASLVPDGYEAIFLHYLTDEITSEPNNMEKRKYRAMAYQYASILWSGEFNRKYKTTEDFVEHCYHMILHRTSESGGFQFWVDQINRLVNEEHWSVIDARNRTMAQIIASNESINTIMKNTNVGS